VVLESTTTQDSPAEEQ
jgi:hypothetical protein